jgi:hypothetical protein
MTLIGQIWGKAHFNSFFTVICHSQRELSAHYCAPEKWRRTTELEHSNQKYKNSNLFHFIFILFQLRGWTEDSSTVRPKRHTRTDWSGKDEKKIWKNWQNVVKLLTMQ